MNKQMKGALTIEAAIVLPIVCFMIFGVLYFAKLCFIQDQIQSVITRVAHEMSVDAYAIDQVGLIDLQQQLYAQGTDDLQQMNEAVNHVFMNAGAIKEDLQGLTDYSGQVGSFVGDLSEIKSGTISETLESAIELVKQGPDLAKEMSDNMSRLVSSVEGLITDMSSHLVGIGLMEIVDLSNGVLADKMIESKFYDMISTEQLVAWGVMEGGKLDFSDSTYLLVDDTIEIAVQYNLDMPFFHSFFHEGIPIYQTVTVRAWTGSYDAGDQKHRVKQTLHQENTTMSYYIATNSEENYAYHLYSCLKKPLKYGTYQQIVQLAGRSACQYCRTHYALPEKDELVYFTSEGSKVHYNDQCPRIQAVQIVMVTEEEALALGKSPCQKHGCVVETKAKLEESNDNDDH